MRNGKNGINKGTMVYILVLINAFLFFASKYGGISTSALYLDHYRPAWYQVFTSTFCHANLQVIWMFYTILKDILSFWQRSTLAATCFHCLSLVDLLKKSSEELGFFLLTQFVG